MSTPSIAGSGDTAAHGKKAGDSGNESGLEKGNSPLSALAPEVTIPPEGGLAGWLCVVGSFIGLFCTFGFLAAIGVYQTTYEETFLKTYTPSNISWIFAVQLSLMWILGPVFGRIVDSYGPTVTLVPCSILCVFSLCMLSLSTEYYQIFLSQGLGFGLGAGGIFTTCFVVVGQWFVKRRGLALGVVTTGSSFGGVIFPFLVRETIQDVGFAGSTRFTALFIGILLAIACVIVKARLPRKSWNKDLAWFDARLLMTKNFGIYTLGAYLVMWGLWAPFDYISTFALGSGFSGALSIYLIAILNAASIPGRIIPGWAADKLGYFNLMAMVSILAGLSVLCLWIPFDYHRSHAGIIVFALAYGLSSGAYISLMMPCAAKSGSLDTLGQRFGTFQSVISIAALTGLPIQGAILNAQNGSYLGLQIFSVIAMIGGGLVIAVARMYIAKSQGSAKV